MARTPPRRIPKWLDTLPRSTPDEIERTRALITGRPVRPADPTPAPPPQPERRLRDWPRLLVYADTGVDPGNVTPAWDEPPGSSKTLQARF